MKVYSLLIFLSLSFTNFSFSQDESEKPKKKKIKFQAGLLVGSLFANKYSTTLYDGYGYDQEGKKNNFINSFMYRRIVVEYGGGFGQSDQIAEALGVNPGEWSFDQTDMPQGVKYNPAFVLGLQLSFPVSKKDALLLNVNAIRLSLTGNFSIVITTPPIGPQQPGYQNIQAFEIKGNEQRLTIQTGYRKILGDDDIVNFFVEGGPSINFTKYLGNSLAINNLHIDLGTYYTQSFYTTYRAKYLTGMGLGAFAGLGVDIAANPNWNMQLVYSPSVEKINIGENPKMKLQHTLALRVFYNL